MPSLVKAVFVDPSASGRLASHENAAKFYGKGGLSLDGFILVHELTKQPASVRCQ